MNRFEVGQNVLVQNIRTPTWCVGRVIDICNCRGTLKYIVDVADHRGNIIYRDVLSFNDKRLRIIPSNYPDAYIWDPKQVKILERTFTRFEFVWAAVRVPRQYGVNKYSEVWVPAMYIEKISPSRHSVFVFEGPYADADLQAATRVRDYDDTHYESFET